MLSGEKVEVGQWQARTELSYLGTVVTGDNDGIADRRYRVAYLVSHPIQYQAPMLRHLSLSPWLDLQVWFLSDFSVSSYRDDGFKSTIQWDVPLLDGYAYRFLCKGERRAPTFWRPQPARIASGIRRETIDALWMHGWANQAQVRAALIARARGVAVLVRGESSLVAAPELGIRSSLKSRIVPSLLRLADGYLVIGSRNQEWYESHGVPVERMFSVPYAVDNNFFRLRANAAAPVRDSFRRKLELREGRPVILFASKLQYRKRARDVVEAWARLSPDGRQEPDPYLIVVGDGEERGALEEYAISTGWSNFRFVGFVNQTGLPAYYDVCDVFVLPSEHEPWGLVVNEVMNAGRPVIVSDQVGCAKDLVIEGVTGHTFPTGNVSELSQLLRIVTTNLPHTRAMGASAAAHVGRWNFDLDAAGLRHALEATVKR